MPVKHRWSGWPEAWCLDCGVEDPREIDFSNGGNGNVDETDCSEPGSHRHDPYFETSRFIAGHGGKKHAGNARGD